MTRKTTPYARKRAQGKAHMFGQRALYVGCWTCTGSDLVRLGYAGGAA